MYLFLSVHGVINGVGGIAHVTMGDPTHIQSEVLFRKLIPIKWSIEYSANLFFISVIKHSVSR